MIRSVALLALVVGCTAPAWAQDCKPLRQITSLNATPLADSPVLTVDARFNGTAKPMLVETGALISTLRQDAVSALGLHTVTNSSVVFVKGKNKASEGFVQVDDFTVGTIRVPRMQLEVPPDSEGHQPWAGVLGSDLFSVYDMEIDAAGHKVNIFAKDHCPGHVLYWSPTAVAVLPFQGQLPTADQTRTGFNSYFERGMGIYVPVKLDGHDITASISSGSSHSSISASMAKFMFGVTADSPGSTPMPSSDGDPRNASFMHTFPTLTFDTVTVSNARVLVYSDDNDIAASDYFKRTDTRLQRNSDYFVHHMTIGMDILRRLRIFVAFGEKKLYITPATAPFAPAAAITPASTPPVPPAAP